jgi:hypothetical protein
MSGGEPGLTRTTDLTLIRLRPDRPESSNLHEIKHLTQTARATCTASDAVLSILHGVFDSGIDSRHG